MHQVTRKLPLPQYVLLTSQKIADALDGMR